MAEPRTFIFVRHAERKAAGADPALTEAGHARAKRLAAMLRDLAVTAIFTSEFLRTRQTAQPLEAASGVAAREVSADLDQARTELLGGGNGVVVVGHTNTVPDLVAAVGGPGGLNIADDEFDRLLVLTLRNGKAALVPLRY